MAKDHPHQVARLPAMPPNFLDMGPHLEELSLTLLLRRSRTEYNAALIRSGALWMN